jgi:hypothetical protein
MMKDRCTFSIMIDSLEYPTRQCKNVCRPHISVFQSRSGQRNGKLACQKSYAEKKKKKIFIRSSPPPPLLNKSAEGWVLHYFFKFVLFRLIFFSVITTIEYERVTQYIFTYLKKITNTDQSFARLY